jgi:hypothetical protein
MSLFYLKNRLTLHLLLIMFFGIFWSLQEVFWNGLWDWNLLEISNLLIIFILLLKSHFLFLKQQSGNVFILSLSTIYSFNHFLDIKSNHSFFSIPINNYSSKNTLVFIILFFKNTISLIVLVFLIFYIYISPLYNVSGFIFNKFFVFFLIKLYFCISIKTLHIYINNYHLFIFFFYIHIKNNLHKSLLLFLLNFFFLNSINQKYNNHFKSKLVKFNWFRFFNENTQINLFIILKKVKRVLYF